MGILEFNKVKKKLLEEKAELTKYLPTELFQEDVTSQSALLITIGNPNVASLLSNQLLFQEIGSQCLNAFFKKPQLSKSAKRNKKRKLAQRGIEANEVATSANVVENVGENVEAQSKDDDEAVTDMKEDHSDPQELMNATLRADAKISVQLVENDKPVEKHLTVLGQSLIHKMRGDKHVTSNLKFEIGNLKMT